MSRSADLLDSDLCMPFSQARFQNVPSPHDALEHRQLVTVLLRILSPRIERVIRLYYGIGVPAMPMAEIAREFDVTRNRIDMLHTMGIERMRLAARWIDAHEPGLSSTRSASMPRAWTMPNLDVQNHHFVERLDAARRSAPPSVPPRRSKRRRATATPPGIQRVPAIKPCPPAPPFSPEAGPRWTGQSAFAPSNDEAVNHIRLCRAALMLLPVGIMLGLFWLGH